MLLDLLGMAPRLGTSRTRGEGLRDLLSNMQAEMPGMMAAGYNNFGRDEIRMTRRAQT